MAKRREHCLCSCAQYKNGGPPVERTWTRLSIRRCLDTLVCKGSVVLISFPQKTFRPLARREESATRHFAPGDPCFILRARMGG